MAEIIKNPYEGCKCRKGHEVQILRSNAGYYLGTVDDGAPYCRISTNYVRNRQDAHILMPDRVCMENTFCNGGMGCGLDTHDEEDYDEPDIDDGSNIGCKDCPDDECTGHCMSCPYRPI